MTSACRSVAATRPAQRTGTARRRGLSCGRTRFRYGSDTGREHHDPLPRGAGIGRPGYSLACARHTGQPRLTDDEGREVTTQTHPVDHELVQAAADVARTRCRGDNHTMAAAARARDGRIVTAVNAYHFTGGPCAELVLIGAAAAQGVYELDTIVAVGDRDRGVVPPCGRCRQVLLDYFPDLKVIVGTDARTRTVRITDLLPETYVWADHQLDAE